MTDHDRRVEIVAEAIRPRGVQRVDLNAPDFDPDDRTTWTFLPSTSAGPMMTRLAIRAVEALERAGEFR